MRIHRFIGCKSFPCRDVNHGLYVVPGIDVQVEKIRMVMIAEAAPPNPKDYFYAKGKPLFAETTVQAFRDAGVNVESVRALLDMGVYLTTAVKCGKTGYAIKATTIQECSRILEKELVLFPKLKAILLMGDAAIKAMNRIATQTGEGRVIPAGSTYKIRHGRYFFRGTRVFPSYLQAGPAFFIEKSKRKMIAEDISSAVKLLS